MRVLTSRPLNAETVLPAQVGVITPNARFYVRNHFDIPELDPATWRLSVSGQVDRPLSLSLAELRRLPSRSLVVTLECAGNGRALLDRPVEGEQWQLGAVSTAEWTGIPLAAVLDRAGIGRGAREIVFRGADRGTPRGQPEALRFERSLPLDDARHPDVVLAYAMNGEPLPAEHGFPLRLVVPGWYGMASVKWLAEIEVADRSFAGYFQVDRYVIDDEPLLQIRVRALITEPADGATVPRGDLAIRGLAWSGRAPVTRVDVALGDRWSEAQLLDEPLRHAWRRWELTTRVDSAGDLVLRARATDASGDTQPDRPFWNRLGYGNNVVQTVRVEVHDA
jgi:DMSO/TMAO reductase YedYZ molybdopterin-dependent catalytic subunit